MHDPGVRSAASRRHSFRTLGVTPMACMLLDDLALAWAGHSKLRLVTAPPSEGDPNN